MKEKAYIGRNIKIKNEIQRRYRFKTTSCTTGTN